MCEVGDALLFIVSAWRKTNWSSFEKAFDELHRRKLKRLEDASSERPRYLRYRAARLLVSLGHCDADFKGENRHLVVAPAILASLPAPGLPRAVLCGARSLETIVLLRKACAQMAKAVSLTIRSQESRTPFAPSRIEVEGESDQILCQLASELGIPYVAIPPSWALTKMSGSLGEYLESLQFGQDQELNWEREDFDPDKLKFIQSSRTSDGLRLSRYHDPVRLQWLYRLWKGRMSAEIDPLWGRFAILREAGKQVLRYDKKTGVAAVPGGTPLPPLLSRALTLCSGYAPQFFKLSAVEAIFPERFGFDNYIGVPPDVLALVASKVGQEGHIEQQLVLAGSER